MEGIQFDYGLKEEVRINELGLNGVVTGYFYGDSGVQYQVTFFQGFDRKVFLLFPQEISRIKRKREFGYPTK